MLKILFNIDDCELYGKMICILIFGNKRYTYEQGMGKCL